jgi:hypothetical protein
MVRFGRLIRQPVVCALCLVVWVYAGQGSAAQSGTQAKFVQPTVVATGGQVATFVAGDFDGNGLADFLYVNAPAVVAGVSQVTAGMLLRQPNGSYLNLPGNQVTFTNVTNVVAAVADFDGDGVLDYAFATSPPTSTGGNYLCVYYGTGAAGAGNAYSSSKSGCMSFLANASLPPNFGFINVFPFKVGGVPSLLVEDTANGALYVLANSGLSNGTSGVLSTFTASSITCRCKFLWPIYSGDFNQDGNTDFITDDPSGDGGVYLGGGDGTFPTGEIYDGPRSMLLHDMTGNGIIDIVGEISGTGILTLGAGNPGGCTNSLRTCFTTSTQIPVTPSGGAYGGGGHLVAIADLNGDGIPDILTSTPIGVSVLLGQGNLSYKLAGIYNAGPGTGCYYLGDIGITGIGGISYPASGNVCLALADFNGDGKLDLAVASPEGIAILYGNGDGTFQSNRAYPALAPALSATVNRFRTLGNPDGNLDVLVGTGSNQAQLLTGNGDGTFNTFPSVANSNLLNTRANLWSTALSGDFNGDGIPDLAYSLTGLPLSAPGAGDGSGVYLQYGNGDGTFTEPVLAANQLAGSPSNNNLYGETVVGDFNGDGISDIANVDQLYFDTLLGQSGDTLRLGLNNPKPSSVAYPNADSFPLVAAGLFRDARTGISPLLRTAGPGYNQDLVFVDGATITPYLTGGDGIHFTAMPALSSPPDITKYYPASVQFIDVDGDGKGDIVIAYHNVAVYATNLGAVSPPAPNTATPNLLYIWYGNGNGTFAAPVVTTLGRNYYLSAVADMNGDGLPDILLSDGYLIDILYNLGSRVFGNEQHLLAGQGINSITVADVNNDGKPDLVVANGGATLSNGVAIGGGIPNVPSISLTANNDVNTGGITVLLNTSPTNASLAATSVTLALCVDGSAGFPCPANPATQPPILTPIQMYYGETLNGTASANANNGSELSPTSSITFLQSGTPICTVPVLPNSLCPAMAGMDIPAGSYTMTAVYNGDALHATSTSNAIVVNVLADTTTATLTSSLNPSQFGQAVTFTATLNGGYAIPTGTVAFYDGTTQIGTRSLVASGSATSTATFTTSTLAIGTHPMTVSYAATQNFAAATSTVVNQVVNINPINLEDFSIALASPSLTIETQHHTTTSVTLTSLLNFSGNISLSCASPPPYVTCLFTPNPAVMTANGTTTVSLYIDTDYVLGYARNEARGWFGGGGLRVALGLLLMPFGAFAVMRKRYGGSTFRPLVLPGVVLPVALALVSCGSSVRPASTPPGTYIVPITATGTPTGGSVPITHAEALTLVVTR